MAWLKKEKMDEGQLEILAEALKKGILVMFRERTESQVPIKAVMEKKRITEFMKKMRVTGLDKFTTPSFVSTVNYYANDQDMLKKKTLGALVVYVEEDYVSDLLRMFRYPAVDLNNDEALKDACGALANIIAGRFKDGMTVLGFADLAMSPFSNYRNTAMHGVDFYSQELNKYEIVFYIRDTKRLIVELTMGPVNKK